MSLLGKIPFPRSQGDFFKKLFSTDEGHDHDGTNSKAVAAISSDATVTVDNLEGLAALSALAVKSDSFAQGDGDDNELLAADGSDDRAVLIVAYVNTALLTTAEFSIHTGAAPGTEIVGVDALSDVGDYYVGAVNLGSADVLNVSATAGDAGNIIATVFALKDSE